MSKNLYSLFANVYSLYLKTQCYHWNVKGQNFLEMHKLFESQYEALAEDVDEFAEKIRSLGSLVPANFTELKNASSIKDANEQFSSVEMIKDLIFSYKEIFMQIRNLFDEFEKVRDLATVDLLTQKLVKYEKHVWFLESFLL